MESLPVLYYANKNAWITPEMLPVLDNSTAHPHLDYLKNIQFEFLSPNTTSLVQPMDMGIIKKIENFISLKIGKLHSCSNSRKSTYIVFNN
jgi:hypothetical protein